MRLIAAFLFLTFVSQIIAGGGSCTKDSDCGNTIIGINSTLKKGFDTNRGICDIINNVCRCNQNYRGPHCEDDIPTVGDAYTVSDDMNVYRFPTNDFTKATKVGNVSSYIDGVAEGMGAYDYRNDRLFLYGTKNNQLVLVVLNTNSLGVETWSVPQNRDFVSFQYDVVNDVLRGMITNPLELVEVNKTNPVGNARPLNGVTDVVNGFSGYDAADRIYYYVAYTSTGIYQMQRYSYGSNGSSPSATIPDNVLAFAYSEWDKSAYIIVPLNSNQVTVHKIFSVVNGVATVMDTTVGSNQINAAGVYFGVTTLVADRFFVRYASDFSNTTYLNNIATTSSNTLTTSTTALNPVNIFVRPGQVACDGRIGPVPEGDTLYDWDCDGRCVFSDPLLCYNNGTHCVCPPSATCLPGTRLASFKDCEPCTGDRQYTPGINYRICQLCTGPGVFANAAHTDCVQPTVLQFSTLVGDKKFNNLNNKQLYFYSDIITQQNLVDANQKICVKFTYGTTETLNLYINIGAILPEETDDLFAQGVKGVTKTGPATVAGSTVVEYCIPGTSFTSRRRQSSWQVNFRLAPSTDVHVLVTPNYGAYVIKPTPSPSAATGGNVPGTPAPTTPGGGSNTPPPPPPPPPKTDAPTQAPPIIFNQQSSSGKGSSASLAWIAGPVIGVICIVLIIVAIVVIVIVLRKKKTEKQEEMQTYGSIAPAGGANYGSVDVGSNYGSTAGGAAYGSTAGAAGATYGSTAAAAGGGAVYGEANPNVAGNRQSAYAPAILREVNMANAIAYSELQSTGKILGQGAFGVVKAGNYRGRKVAIKEIKPDNVDERELKAFAEEADLMMQLDTHENVVAFIGVCTEPFCIVSEFMGKGDLNTYLLSDSAIPDMMKLKILLDIAKGMNFLAKQGIVHRDLAARNILLDDSMTAKVSDFGLSRLLDTESAVYTKSATGPVKWMAPEQLTKRKASEKSDVWMYGVLTFEVVTRGPPYPNMNLTEVCVSVANNQLRPTFPDSTPAILKELTDSIFNYSPEARPSFSDIVVKLSSNDDKSGYVLAPGEQRY